MTLQMVVTTRATWTMPSASNDPQTHAVLSSTKWRTPYSGSTLQMVCVTMSCVKCRLVQNVFCTAKKPMKKAT